MKKLFTLLVFLLTLEALPQEVIIIDGPRNELYIYEEQLVKGDKDALKEIGKFLGSNKKIFESLGYHLLYTKEKEISLRIIEENTLFTSEEIKLDSNLTASAYKKFISDNYENIKFSDKLGVFYITQPDNRDVNYRLKKIPDFSLKKIKKNKIKNFSFFEKKHSEIITLLNRKNPECLKKIAELNFYYRNKFNKYNFDEIESCIDLLKLLTKTDLQFFSYKDSVYLTFESYDIKNSEALLLFYWSKHYIDYTFDEKEDCFVNTHKQFDKGTRIENLFELICSPDDTVAMNAFIMITELPPDEVKKGAFVFNKKDILVRANYVVGLFPERKSVALSLFTDYCKKKNINYKGDEVLRQKILKLNEEMEMKDRIFYENHLIESLTLKDITVLEYLASLYENGGINNSAAIILDRFYSRHWQEILNSEENLNFYIKKASCFSNFGIIGACNYFYSKFENADKATLDRLMKIDTTDGFVKNEVAKILILNSDSIKAKLDSIRQINLNEMRNSSLIGSSYQGVYKYFDTRENVLKIRNKFEEDNYNSFVEDASAKILNIFESNLDKDEKERKINKIIAEISYEEILSIISLYKKISFERWDYIADFVKSDFGIPINSDYISDSVIQEFIFNYKKFSEYELYEYYLDKAGVDYKNSTGSLDYDKIYPLLKYNQMDYFTGGENYSRQLLVYALIKLLEINFNTTLGFPKKLCNSGDTYRCTPNQRAEIWRLYLMEKNLVSYKDTEPPAFYDD
ncbi:MAG: hypothetical protein JSS63_06720 [Bacteroidetes bacterium]|nr:hypothetical protein [Bacteroidota bacterium]